MHGSFNPGAVPLGTTSAAALMWVYGGTAKFAVAHLSASVSQTDVGEAIYATDEDTRDHLADLVADEAQTTAAVRTLQAGGCGSYHDALALLREDTQSWWHQVLVEPDAEREPYSPDAESLLRFLQEEVGEWYENRRGELEHRPLIKSQAVGEALEPNRLEQLSRYEVHLDRKLERTLSMLLKLQEMKRPARSA
jgi:hypothetical protein